MDQFLRILQDEWSDFLQSAPKIIAAVIVVLASYIVGRLLAALVRRILRRFADARLPTTFFRTLVVILTVFVGVLIALQILGLEGLAFSLMAGGGVTAIILGFAFREIGENLLAGLFLAFSRPFNLGDTIRSEDLEGVVKAIDLRSTHLRTVDGRDVFVPSSQLFSKPVTNFTRDGLRRFTFDVGIDYGHDAEQACREIKRALDPIPGPLPAPPLEVHVSGLLAGYVQLTVWFWVDVFDASQPVPPIQDRLMNVARGVLKENGYVVSSEVTTALEFKSPLTIQRDGTDASV